MHKSGNEEISDNKTFKGVISILRNFSILSFTNIGTVGSYCDIRMDSSNSNRATTTIRDNYQGNFHIGHSYQGEGWESGAALGFFYSTGNFSLSACAGSNATRRDLLGKSDGTLTWNGQPIQTSSDERLKTPISDVNSDILDAWDNIQWGEFKFLDAVEEKGENARYHIGLIAQSVDRIFKNGGRDILKYGILCHEEREATEDEKAIDEWQVRYTEALCMEAAYQRRENRRLKEKVASLEERLASLEEKLK